MQNSEKEFAVSLSGFKLKRKEFPKN